jgi:hypothetical protein
MFTAKTDVRSPTQRDYVVCYSLYALLLMGSIVTLLIWRVTILLFIITMIGLSPANGSIYAVSLIVIGIGLFMLVIAAEPYLRNGVKRGQLMHRFARVALPVVIASMLGLLLSSWM